MKLLLPFLGLTFLAQAQDATTLASLIYQLLHPPTTVLTVTASQGDGTTCTVGKVAGSSIYATSNCVNQSTGSSKGTTLLATGTAQSTSILSFGDVLCLFILNPTSTAVIAQGSWTAIAPISIGWQCTTNIRSSPGSGSVTGQTAVVAGSVSWP